MRTAADSSDEQSSGFAAVQLAQRLRRNLLAFIFKVEALTADHAKIACAHSHLAYSFNQSLRLNIFLLQHNLKGQRQQTVASQHSHCLAKNLMVGQAATTIIIVIHAGQVIMNQGICMNHFQTAGYRQIVIALAAQSLSRCHQKNRTDALASGHQAVFHRLIDLGNAFFSNTVLQIILYQLLLVSIISFKVHYFASKS